MAGDAVEKWPTWQLRATEYPDWRFKTTFGHFGGPVPPYLKSTPKVLERTSSPLQNFWSAIQVHPKKIGVHSKSTPKTLECTKFHCKNGKFLQ
jgi:hypothetical protein